MLYLDGDLIVEQDLGELYSENLGDCYVAAVEDSGTLYWKNQYHNSVEHYFNSGVMLLNVKKMREENIKDILIETKKNISDSSLMDQNIFNLIFDGKVKPLPVSYNFLPLSLDRAGEKWNIDSLNKKYKTDYKTKSELISNASIIHFSSKDKPWKEPCAALAYKWRHYYLSLNGDNSIEHKERYGISAVITCHNAENQIENTVKSVLNQNFSDFEIILVDYGSTDATEELIQKYTEKNNNITSYHLTESSKENACNFGIKKAQGKYIHFIDCGDVIEPDCWKKAYSYAIENEIQLMIFNSEDENAKEVISEVYPKTYTGKELFSLICNSEALHMRTGMMIAKREFLTENGIAFPETGTFADKFYIYKTITNATSVIVLPGVFYKTGIHESINSSDIGEKEKIISLFSTIIKLTDDYSNQEDINECNKTAFKYIQALCAELKKQYYSFEKKYGKEKCIEELGTITSAVDLCMFIASSGAHSGLCKCTGELYRELNAKLKQTYKEKSEINAKLLQTYREKSELNAKLKQTYKEKSEKTKQIKRLEKYSLYPLLKKIKKSLKK